MFKKIATLMSAAVVLTFSANAGTWSLDQSHSKVRFTVPHLMISEVDGAFRKFDVKLSASKDDFSDAVIDFTADVNSINTENEQRDNHLKGDDFFNAEKFPQIKFKASSMKKVGKNKYKLTGDFTIRDVTKKITFDVVHNGTIKDPWGNTKAGFKLTGKINRFDYGLKWNKAMEAGGMVVGENVTIICDIELAKEQKS